ncbi:hypothetical protein J6590_007914 [Homalodisca vitripennis]|nr:hypothetical protein J6590_007914 [Homalodisca vitripennis]
MLYEQKQLAAAPCPPKKSNQELKILIVVNLYILEAVYFHHLKLPEAATGVQNHSYNTRHASSYQLPVHRLPATERPIVGTFTHHHSYKAIVPYPMSRNRQLDEARNRWFLTTFRNNSPTTNTSDMIQEITPESTSRD